MASIFNIQILIFFFLLIIFSILRPTQQQQQHPLDPLTPSELNLVQTILTHAYPNSNNNLTFQYVGLDDPDKPTLPLHHKNPTTQSLYHSPYKPSNTRTYRRFVQPLHHFQPNLQRPWLPYTYFR